MSSLPTRARFPEVPLKAGHYESFYVKAAHPSEPQALWIRYTVHKRPGASVQGSLWLTFFDGSAGGPWAAKETRAEVGAAADHYIHVGESVLAPDRAHGRLRAGAKTAEWDLELRSSEPPLRHLPRDWMYRAPLPRTKLLSPYPAAAFRGRAELSGQRLELEGWRGMVGHNWGAQHAERWIWIHGAGFEEAEGAWLDAAIGRIKLGPLTSPWIANGTLSLGGERHRLGGLERVRTTEVRERPDRCEFVLPGSDITVQGEVGADARNFVGWVYADPDGSEHHTVNCSISDMTLGVSRPDRAQLTLTLRGGAAYELGMRERDHGVPIQPFPDG